MQTFDWDLRERKFLLEIDDAGEVGGERGSERKMRCKKCRDAI